MMRFWIRVLWYLIEGHKFYGGGDAPASPDYVGAAKAQGAANLATALQNAMANNPNINNPFGDQEVTWSKVGGRAGTPAVAAKAGYWKGTGKNRTWVPPVKAKAAVKGVEGTWQSSVKQTLKPEQKALLDKGNQAKMINADTATTLSGNVQKQLSTPMQEAPRYREDVVQAMMSRFNEDYKQQADQSNSDLIAAGIRPGAEAFERVKTREARGRNDALQSAILSGGQEATRDFGMDIQGRNQGINELNALQSGSQLSNPFAGSLGYQGGFNSSASPTFAGVQAQGQAQQNQYNANQAAMNGNINAGAGLIGSLGQGAISKWG